MAGRAARGGTRARKNITPETGISGSFDDTEYKEKAAGYDGPDPTPGLYKAKLTSVGQHTTTDDAIVWTFDITDGKYAGWRGWVYTNMSSAKWKTQDILVALGVMEPEGEINHTWEEIEKKAQPLRVRIISEPYEDERRAKIKSFLTLDPNAEPAEEAAAEEDPDFTDDPKPAPTRARRSRTKDPEPEPEEPAAEEPPAAIDLEELEEELEKLDLAGLKKKAKEFGMTRQEIKEADDDEDELIDAILDKAEEQNPPF